MKIGILACGYNCSQYFNQVFEAWINKKKQDTNNEFIISCCYGIFKEYNDIYKNNNISIEEDGTLNKLKELQSNNIIDNIFEHNNLAEADARSGALQYLLESKCDIIWLLDIVDEIYTEENIERIIKFVEKYNESDYYKINFKNYVFDDSHFLRDFTPSRIFWNDGRKGGIKKLFWDNDFEFNDGTKTNNNSAKEIPRNFVEVKHYSWNGNKEYLKNKVQYQYLHFGNGNCSYKWNDEKDCLEFDESFFQRFNLSKPIVYQE